MRGKTPYAAASIALLTIASCTEEPKLAAEGSGDLSNPPALRTAPDTALSESCGRGAQMPGDVALGRLPYLQSVGASSARVLFVSPDASDFSVRLSRPDDTVVQDVTAVLDADARPANGGRLREAQLRALEPDTVYCYAVMGATERAGFRTAPDAGSVEPVRFVAWGDSGTGSSYQAAVAAQMQTVPYDFAIHTGDLAYEDGTRDELESYFFGVYPRLTRSFSVFPVIGNHDRAAEDGAALREAFRFPEGYSSAAAQLFYSFDWGPVHFVALDTERIDASQADRLDSDLERNSLPWTIVIGHRPPFSSGEHGSDAAFQRAFVPVLEKHRVPLVLSGHEHDYERTVPINGVNYVVTGGGGRGTRPVSRSAFTAYSEDVLHFVYVEIEGATLLLHAIDGVGREFDSLKIEHR